VPEPLVAAWAPFARRRALRLLADETFDCAITTSPPESGHLIGRALRKRGLPWVADVRDAWTFEPLRPRFPTGLQRRFDERLERRWLGAADAVVSVSRTAAEDIRDRLGIDATLVPNGWDPDLGPEDPGSPQAVDPLPLADPDRVSLVYTGRFGSYGRDPRPLVEALGQLARHEPAVAGRIELVVAGPLTEDERALLSTDVAPARIVARGSLDRVQALALQRSADALLLLASPVRTQLLNIKLFEYLAAGRPILALAEGTEAGRVAAELGAEVVRADCLATAGVALGRRGEQYSADAFHRIRAALREGRREPALERRVGHCLHSACAHERRAIGPSLPRRQVGGGAAQCEPFDALGCVHGQPHPCHATERGAAEGGTLEADPVEQVQGIAAKIGDRVWPRWGGRAAMPALVVAQHPEVASERGQEIVPHPERRAE
jgi:glycosyltransferase involved in cell wall biosynthesis